MLCVVTIFPCALLYAGCGGAGPSSAALQWADSNSAASTDGGSSAGAAPKKVSQAAWQELGATARPQGEPPSSRLQQAAWRFLDRLQSTGAAAASTASSPAAWPPLLHAFGSSMQLSGYSRRGSGLALADPTAASAASGPAVLEGLSGQQAAHLERHRALLLLQRLLLAALQHAPPEAARQAAAQAAQLLPLLLPPDSASDDAAAMAAASSDNAGAGGEPGPGMLPPHLQVLLAAVIQCYRSIAISAVAAQKEQQVQAVPLPLQQRLTACTAAASAIVMAVAPAAASALLQRSPQRLLQELSALLQPEVVAEAACQQVLFMQHCCLQYQAAVPQLLQQLASATEQLRQSAGAAEEWGQECLGALQAADRLRRAAGRQAAEEQRQQRRRCWRDLWRGLTSGRGLWAEEEREEGALVGGVLCLLFHVRRVVIEIIISEQPENSDSALSLSALPCALLYVLFLCHLCLDSLTDLHWKLDRVEDPSRRRLRLRRNYHFERWVQGNGFWGGVDACE